MIKEAVPAQANGAKVKKVSKISKRNRKTRRREGVEHKSYILKFSKDFQKWCRLNNIPIAQETHLKQFWGKG